MPPTATSHRLRDRYEATRGRVQMTGIQALARLPIEQHRRDRNAGRDIGTLHLRLRGLAAGGLRPRAGPPIKDLLEANDVTFVPGLNEEPAATAVQGSQLVATLDGAQRDGVTGHLVRQGARARPGHRRPPARQPDGRRSRAAARCVLVGDDPAAKSSSVPCASELALADLADPAPLPGRQRRRCSSSGCTRSSCPGASGLWVGAQDRHRRRRRVLDRRRSRAERTTPGPSRPAPKQHVPTGRLLQPDAAVRSSATS